ncbi:hypothetical protein [Endomicrobium proavitum]|uniref:Uncharacterized protein n=1 Tax=Endomicrobium proavitum TaxID=1408281 RepID=A0A0G3WK00_9BACT|nr:hypothetical protein [Endomicrobium proavitum]AKL98220.1 exported protein of unknown function [Endomicrobium proavitum]
MKKILISLLSIIILNNQATATLGYSSYFPSMFTAFYEIVSQKSNTDSAWVTEQTSLTGGNNVNINVGNKTTVTGAVIASASDNLTLTTKALEHNDIEDRNITESKGFGLSTSIGTSQSDKGKTNVAPNGSTTLTLKNTGEEKEQITKATIGNGTIIISGVEQTENDLQGLNRNTETTQETTKDIITGALDASATIDNRALLGFIKTEVKDKDGKVIGYTTGYQSIANDFANLDTNLAQIGKGLTNNIVTQSIKNALLDSETNIIEAALKYIEDDKKAAEIQANKELTDKLNGLTNYEAEGVRDALQETADIAAAGGGFAGEVELYNEGIENRGYAYEDGENKTIGINTNKTDLTKSGNVINTVFHETESIEGHANEQTAINRGNTAEAIWDLKNFGNANTNKLTSSEWNASNAGSAVLNTGNNNAIRNAVNDRFGIGTMNAYDDNIDSSAIVGEIINNVFANFTRDMEVEAQNGYPTFRAEAKKDVMIGGVILRDNLTSYPLYQDGGILIDNGRPILGWIFRVVGGALDFATVAPIIGEGAVISKQAVAGIIKKEATEAIAKNIAKHAIAETAGKAVEYAGVKEASAYLMSQGVSRNRRIEILNSFDIRTITVSKADNATYGLRFFDNQNSLPVGHYLFDTFTPLTNRANLAVPPQWSLMSGVNQFQIKEGATIIKGKAGSQLQYGSQYVGGAEQWYIQNLDNLLQVK